MAKFIETAWQMKPDEVPAPLERAREAYARSFDADPIDQRRIFCERFPDWVSEASKDVPSPPPG